MGQYYPAMILGEQARKETIRMWMSAHTYGQGLKLMEHSYIGNPFVSAFEFQISEDGPFYKSRVVWAGDYANTEPESDRDGLDLEMNGKNLYTIAREDENTPYSRLQKPPIHNTKPYRYIVNHTKKQYVDKNNYTRGIHPLPLLTSEGNGAGGGDYRGTSIEYCGSWARDVISLDRNAPEDYSELRFELTE